MRKCLAERAWLLAAVCVLAVAPAARAQEVSAQLLPERNTLYLGETITVTLLVDGDDAPGRPDLSSVEDFYVRFLQGRSIDKAGQQSYAFQYDFMPKRTGEFTLPVIRVEAGGGTRETAPVTITVLAPEPTKDLRIVSTLSQSQCYVGEPVTLTVVWYCALPLQTVKAVDLQVPVLRDRRFSTFEPRNSIASTAPTAVGLPVSDTRIIAERGEGDVDGQTFATLTFRRILVPRESGKIDIDGGTVYCAAITPDARSRRSWNQYPSYFDNDFFDQDLETTYTRHFAKGDNIALDVRPLPVGQPPAEFTGIAAQGCTIETAAEPVRVQVNAPLTLTVRLSAERYIEHLDLAPLASQADLTREFEIPPDRALGHIEGGAMVFKQTLRPRSTAVTRIPPIRFAYLDTATGAYAEALSEAIPVTVFTGQEVTAFNAEGSEELSIRDALAEKQEGFQHYYEGTALLRDDRHVFFGWGGAWFWAFMLLIPPMPYALTAARREYLRRTEVPPETLRARQAIGSFKKTLTSIPAPAAAPNKVETYTSLEKALRAYLADKLHLSARSLTYMDVEQPLRTRGIAETIMLKLRDIFEECLAHRFSGGSHVGNDPKSDLERADSIIKELEGGLR